MYFGNSLSDQSFWLYLYPTFNLPAKSENSTLGEITPYTRELMDLLKPNEK